jgi:hypothetical protein
VTDQGTSAVLEHPAGATYERVDPDVFLEAHR